MKVLLSLEEALIVYLKEEGKYCVSKAETEVRIRRRIKYLELFIGLGEQNTQ